LAANAKNSAKRRLADVAERAGDEPVQQFDAKCFEHQTCQCDEQAQRYADFVAFDNSEAEEKAVEREFEHDKYFAVAQVDETPIEIISVTY
jgi:sulfur carrier protein ThiS